MVAEAASMIIGAIKLLQITSAYSITTENNVNIFIAIFFYNYSKIQKIQH